MPLRLPAIACGVAAAIGTAAAVPAAAQQPLTLTFAAHYTDAQMAPLTACFRRYEAENPGVRIVYRQSPIDDFLQTVLTSRIAGTSPDIYNVYSIWGKRLVDNGILDAPPTAIASFVRDGYEASTVRSARLDDRIWGVPAEVSLYMLIYNKKLFAEAGIAAPPTTWREVVENAGKIAKHDANGKIVTAGFAFGPTAANATHPFRTLLFSKGLPLLKDDLASTNLTSPQAVEVLEGMTALFSGGATSPSNVVRDFPAGRVGMQISANWFKDTLRQGLGAAFDDTVGVAPIPGGPDWKTYQYSFYHAVDARSPRKAEAWRLVQWLSTPQGPGKRSCTGDMLIQLGSLTANKADIAASKAELGDAFTRPYVEALQSGRALTDPNIAQTTEIDRVLRTAIESAWLGRQPPKAALEAADAQIGAILAQPQ